MTELVITRGYPASGKTSWALWRVAEPGWARISRDDLRAMMFGRHVLTPDLERLVTVAELAQAAALIEAGVNIVVDATNLRLDHARVWADLAYEHGATFSVHEFPTEADECVRRDCERGTAGGRMVGEQVIRNLAARFPIPEWGVVTPATNADRPVIQS